MSKHYIYVECFAENEGEKRHFPEHCELISLTPVQPGWVAGAFDVVAFATLMVDNIERVAVLFPITSGSAACPWCCELRTREDARMEMEETLRRETGGLLP